MPDPTMPDPILVTVAGGFIGFHLAQRLLDDGHSVVGLDNLIATYDPKLKHARLALLEPSPAFSFARFDVADRAGMALFTFARRILAGEAGHFTNRESPRVALLGPWSTSARHRRPASPEYASASKVFWKQAEQAA